MAPVPRRRQSRRLVLVPTVHTVLTSKAALPAKDQAQETMKPEMMRQDNLQ